MQIVQVMRTEKLLKLLRNNLVESLIKGSDNMMLKGNEITWWKGEYEHVFAQQNNGDWIITSRTIPHQSHSVPDTWQCWHGRAVWCSPKGTYGRKFCVKLLTDLLDKNKIKYETEYKSIRIQKKFVMFADTGSWII